RALGRLLRRVLPQGPEGPDADQARLRRGLRVGHRRARRADVAVGRVQVRRAHRGSGRHVPLRRVHAAREHGRDRRGLAPVRTLGRPARRPAVHRAALVRARAAALRPRLRGDHRRCRVALARTGAAGHGRRPGRPDAGATSRAPRRLTAMVAPVEPVSRSLRDIDPWVADLIDAESERRATTIDLIASESEPVPEVLEALGSVFAAKTAEGYPGRRYHRGTRHADAVEQLAIDRAKALFGAEHANVQPSSGVNANLAVYRATLKP